LLGLALRNQLKILNLLLIASDDFQYYNKAIPYQLDILNFYMSNFNFILCERQVLWYLDAASFSFASFFAKLVHLQNLAVILIWFGVACMFKYVNIIICLYHITVIDSMLKCLVPSLFAAYTRVFYSFFNEDGFHVQMLMRFFSLCTITDKAKASYMVHGREIQFFRSRTLYML
jgi:hypothetical protein